MKNFNITYLSDLDYGYNPITDKFDIPCVEWSNCYGTWWQSFESEEARTAALDANSAYNDKPEVKEFIEAQRLESDISFAMCDVSEWLEHFMAHGMTAELSYMLGGYDGGSAKAKWCMENQPHVVKAVTKAVCTHNKLIMRTRRQPKVATYRIGDVF